MQPRDQENIHLVRLDVGDKIQESLKKYVKDHNIQSGYLSGIGATSHATIAWYDVVTGEYLTTEIDEICELTTLMGNVGWYEGEPLIHAHVTLGKRDYSIIGGHLVEGIIGITGEIWIQASPFKVTRTLSDFPNLKLIDFDA
jgi:hypothetical protein